MMSGRIRIEPRLGFRIADLFRQTNFHEDLQDTVHGCPGYPFDSAGDIFIHLIGCGVVEP